MKKLVVVFGLLLPALTQADETGDRAYAIIDEIVSVCQNKGMLACEPRMHGADELFAYVRMFEQVRALEAEFVRFVKERYPETSGFDFDVLQASLKLSLEISFSPEQLTERVASVEQTEDGYRLIMKDGGGMELRQEKGVWQAWLPPTPEGAYDQFKPLYLAAQLKRSILVYRSMEAEMAGLSRDDLESNVSADLAPVVVAVLGKEQVPALVRWLARDVDDVIGFYQQFQNRDQMAEHIRKVHQL